jgi:four helix bundle protein
MNSHLPPSVVEHALGVIQLLRPLVAVIGRRDRDLASQVRRAASSIALNLEEGFGHSGGNARLRFESALGSAREAHAGLRVALAWGYVSPELAHPALQSLNSLVGRVRGLARR